MAIESAIAPAWRQLAASGHRAPLPSENDAMQFWHARMCIDGRRPPVPQLADLQALARSIRTS